MNRPAPFTQASLLWAMAAADAVGKNLVMYPDGNMSFEDKTSAEQEFGWQEFAWQEFAKVTVYFIKAEGYVKIGITTGPIERRLNALATAHYAELVVLATIENVTQQLEAELHQRFAQYRVRGEWFRLEPEILAYIEELKNGQG